MAIKALIDFLGRHPNFVIQLICHTSSKGASQANLASSQYRADGIKTFLIKNNAIAEARITTKGYGEKYLLYSDAKISLEKSIQKKI